MDRFDIALLNLLQEDNLATAEALATKVALSPSAITRRLRRLRETGAIAAEVAILSPALVERRLRSIVQIQLNEHAQEKGLAELRDRLRAAPEVQLCLEISGAFDMIVIVATRDMAAFNQFADRMLAADPAVRRYETSFVKKQVKASLAVPLDERDAG